MYTAGSPFTLWKIDHMYTTLRVQHLLLTSTWRHIHVAMWELPRHQSRRLSNACQLSIAESSGSCMRLCMSLPTRPSVLAAAEMQPRERHNAPVEPATAVQLPHVVQWLRDCIGTADATSPAQLPGPSSTSRPAGLTSSGSSAPASAGSAAATPLRLTAATAGSGHMHTLTCTPQRELSFFVDNAEV